MPSSDAPEFVDRVVLGVSEPEYGVIRIERRWRAVPRRRNAHADEVDEVAGDDEPPRAAMLWMLSIEVEQCSELAISIVRRVRTQRRIRLSVVDQVATQMHVGENEQVMRSHRTSPLLSV